MKSLSNASLLMLQEHGILLVCLISSAKEVSEGRLILDSEDEYLRRAADVNRLQ